MKMRCPFVYCFIGTLISVFFSEFNDRILFLFPSLTYALYLGAAGPLRIVLSSHRTYEGLHSDWGYIGIHCLGKKLYELTPNSWRTRIAGEEVMYRNHSVIHSPWIDRVGSGVH